MNVQSTDTSDAPLSDEEAALRQALRSLVDESRGSAGKHSVHDPTRLDEIDREIRRIVLRIVQIERERIELRIASAL